MIYAKKGERITCENGHEICTFSREVLYGDEQNVAVDLTNWKQAEPQKGDPCESIRCEICRAEWIRNGFNYHIEGEWR